MTEYHSLKLKQVDRDKLKLDGSKAMIRAIEYNDDTQLISIFSGNNAEAIIVDICCDGIPSKNTVGIDYCERLTFIFENSSSIPETLALRKGFPITMHQNVPKMDQPKSLCIYEESKDVTASYWTAERHLHRVNWWLVKASKNKIHSRMQDVENLFFEPSSSIVLPHDFHMNNATNRKLHATAKELGNSTDFCVKTQWENDYPLKGKSFNVVNVITPPITHGLVYVSPDSFSELNKTFEGLSIDISELIRQQLLMNIKNSSHSNSESVIFIFSVPIKRNSNISAEKHKQIAFLCFNTLLQIAHKFEVVVEENGLLNKTSGGKLNPLQTKNIDFDIVPLECIKETTPEERRKQSGIEDNIQKGIIIGGGSLGGSLIDLWSKSGWGTWTVIDNDDLRPHNFTRHVLYPFWVGDNKAQALKETYNQSCKGSGITSLNVDALKPNAELQQRFKAAEVVIDATASLSYPRAASLMKHVPRHLSAFFSPSGSDAVLLIEDKGRKIRLAALESQYYRMLINHSVGEKHLTGDSQNFRSGVSCRDISVIMSHSRVMSCASLLSEQIRIATAQNHAIIKIWQENITTGERSYFAEPASPLIKSSNHSNNKFEVIWDVATKDKVVALRKGALPNETGGILLGYHDMIHKRVYIVDILPAPPDSEGTPSGFIRGKEGVEEALLLVHKRTANNVSYIGEWHSHPDGSSANRSQLDNIQLTELSENMARDGLLAYQMIVAKNEIKIHEK